MNKIGIFLIFAGLIVIFLLPKDFGKKSIYKDVQKTWNKNADNLLLVEKYLNKIYKDSEQRQIDTVYPNVWRFVKDAERYKILDKNFYAYDSFISTTLKYVDFSSLNYNSKIKSIDFELNDENISFGSPYYIHVYKNFKGFDSLKYNLNNGYYLSLTDFTGP